MDLIGAHRAADTCVKIGVAAAVPTALAGVADWHDTVDRDRRVGLAHALLNSAALGLFVGSIAARGRGSRGLGVGLSTVGWALAFGSAYLGGELVFKQGANVNRTAWDPRAEDFQSVTRLDELVDGRLTGGEIEVDGQTLPIVLLREGGRVHALRGTCAHAGGPLAEGKLVDGHCVECPWHGSTFDMRDGSVVQGPSAYPQPRFETRVRDGAVEVRLAR
jgi:nitrite reductase/ring-hydroxylating ferredoxin subunit